MARWESCVIPRPAMRVFTQPFLFLAHFSFRRAMERESAVNHIADVTHFRFLSRWTFPTGESAHSASAHMKFQYRRPSSLLNPSLQPTHLPSFLLQFMTKLCQLFYNTCFQHITQVEAILCKIMLYGLCDPALQVYF